MATHPPREVVDGVIEKARLEGPVVEGVVQAYVDAEMLPSARDALVPQSPLQEQVSVEPVIARHRLWPRLR